ncbi:MAG: methylated-DNA--[protein]-cysteine S-methyltransferase [Gemmataceae bacterium]
MLSYVTQSSPLGLLGLAGTDQGVKAVFIGEEEAAIVEALTRDLGPLVSCSEARMKSWAEAIAASLDSGAPVENLGGQIPLDIQGTAFQLRVWRALGCIAVGQTRSYREVAQSLGQPTGARAVARACATNPLSVLIPCHRVIRSDGKLGGYRWGLERKRWLLQVERQRGQAARGAARAVVLPKARSYACQVSRAQASQVN